MPEVDPKIFDVLSEVKRQQLIDAGIVKIVPHWSRDFYGPRRREDVLNSENPVTRAAYRFAARGADHC